MKRLITASIMLPAACEVSPPAQKSSLPGQNGLSIGLGLGQGLQRVEVLVKEGTLIYSRHGTEIQAETQTVDKG